MNTYTLLSFDRQSGEQIAQTDCVLERGDYAIPFLHSKFSVSRAFASSSQAIEDGVGPHGPLQLRSTQGGFHSVQKTIAGFDKIVAHCVNKLK